MISLYIHIPFCKKKCSYCSFYSAPDGDKEKYTDALLRCIRYFGQRIKKTVSTVYFGGGTPSLLLPVQLEKVLNAVSDNFDLCQNAEITLEGNPDSLTREFLESAKKIGINRLSIGVQSFVDTELDAISRVHDSKTAVSAIKNAKAVGFDNISCDLIFGIPTQTKDSFIASLDKMTELEVPHISCYNLQLEAGTPLFEKGDFVEDEKLCESMYYDMCDKLSRAGYEHYEISNFAFPSMHSRHNSAYWTGADYLGIGPSAHSKLGSLRAGFDADICKFMQKTEFGFDFSERITDPVFEKIMLGLRTASGIPQSMLKNSADYVQRLVGAGFARAHDGNLSLTDRGFYLSNTIISDITAKEC